MVTQSVSERLILRTIGVTRVLSMPRWGSEQEGAHPEPCSRWSSVRRKRWPSAQVTVAGVATVVVLVLCAGMGSTSVAGASTLGGSTPGATGATAAEVRDPASLVDPFIGTANGGNTFPGADVPFGMVQWSPDTVLRPDGGGYAYSSKSIVGYSLTHLSGTGCPAEGDVPILPTVGAIGSNPVATTAPLDHSDETASPGYYQLDAGGIDTQLTTTTRSGMAVFTFPSATPVGNLLFKLSDSEASVQSSQFHVVNDKEVDGQVTTGYFCGASNTYTLYFDMVFNHPFSTSGSWSLHGNGAYVSFDTTADPVITAKVGISYVSDANAVLNRTTEDPGWDFNAVKNAAQRSWQTMLGKVAVGGGTPTQQTVFYTALYHSLLDPSVYSDVNGQYLGMDGQVHTVVAPQTAQYANYSGWDIYRSEIQLLSLLAPQQTSDIVTSMLNDYAQSGQLPKWDEDDTETYIMVGDPADSIIADAYAFGATNFDASQALSDMETEAEVPGNIRPGLSYYERDGYLPIDGTYGCCNFYGPVSTQQEYDIADNSIAELATDLGDAAVAQTFAVRAQNWQNVFNPGTGFMQPKESAGMFQPAFDPTSENGFVEADSYVYTALVPFDLAGLVAAEGGNAAWVDFLNGLTSNVVSRRSHADPDGQRAVVRDPLGVRLCRCPLADPTGGARDPRPALHRHTDRARRQRRPRCHELLVRVVGARRLPRDAGLCRGGSWQPAVPGDHPHARQRPDHHRDGPGRVAERALRRRSDPRREPLARRLPALQHLHRGRDARTGLSARRPPPGPAARVTPRRLAPRAFCLPSDTWPAPTTETPSWPPAGPPL